MCFNRHETKNGKILLLQDILNFKCFFLLRFIPSQLCAISRIHITTWIAW